MKSKFLTFLCSSVIAVPILFSVNTKNTVVLASQDNNSEEGIYEETTDLDLSKYNITVNGDDLQISKKSSNILDSTKHSLLRYQDSTIKDFNSITIDEGAKDFVKRLLSEGRQVGKLASKTVYVRKTFDEDGNETNERYLTPQEVSSLDLNADGSVANKPENESQSDGRLTVYIAVSDPESREHWLQGSASWNLKGFHSVNSSNSPGDGEDFIGLTWNNKYISKSNPKFTGSYQGGGSINGVVRTADCYGGEVWGFNDSIRTSSYTVLASRVYAGIGLSNTGSASEAGFTCTYIHTWSSKKYSVSIGINSSGANAGLSVSPSDSQKSVAVSTSGFIC